MRWSMVPVSAAAHSLILFAIFVSPIGDSLPTPWPVRGLKEYVSASARLPDVPLPRLPNTVVAGPAIPREAPQGIRNDDVSPSPPGPISEFAVPGITGGPASGLPSDFTAGVSTLPPPPPVQQRPTLVRPGGSIREPKRIVTVAAEYPDIARRARVEGRVVIEAIIDERGVVTDARVLTSVPLLDAAALTALQQWRYTPTLLNGVPVRVLMTITFNFQLDRVP
jgi:periplasmic protein TonB